MLKPIVLLLVGLLIPGALDAQACFSTPAGSRQAALELRRETTPDVSAYGGDLRVNFAGPVTADAGYRLITSDTLHSNGNVFRLGVAGELSLKGISLCGGVAPSRASYREPEVFFDSLGVVLDLQEQTNEVVRLPVEISAGRRFDYGGITLVPSLGAAYVSERLKVTSSKPLESSATFIESRLALAFGLESLFGRVQVTSSNAEGAEPGLSLGLGVLIR